MRNKKFYYLTTLIVTSGMLVFTGCSKKAEPVISKSVEQTEPAEEPEPEEPEPEEPEESLEDTKPTENPANEENLEDVENEIETSEVEEDTEEENEPDLGYEIIPTDEVVMYCTVNSANVRSGPGTDYDKVGSLAYGEAITSNGKVDQDGKVWLVIKDEAGELKMVSGSLVSTTKPAKRAPQAPSQSQQPQQPEAPADGGETGFDNIEDSAFGGMGVEVGGGFGSSGETDGSWDIY